MTDPHECRTGVDHDGSNVGEVGVDQAGCGDEVGDALHTLQEDLVCHLERVEHRRVIRRDRQQSIVGDDDEGVDLLLEFLNALLGLNRSATTFEGERAGDDTDGERTLALCDLGDHRRAPVPVPPPLPAVMNTMSAPASDSRISSTCSSAAWRPTSGSEPAPSPREVAADVELFVGVAHEQRLCIGVGGDEFNALQPGIDHAVDGVDTAAADADDLDDSQIVLRIRHHLGIPRARSSRAVPWHATVRRSDETVHPNPTDFGDAHPR